MQKRRIRAVSKTGAQEYDKADPVSTCIVAIKSECLYSWKKHFYGSFSDLFLTVRQQYGTVSARAVYLTYMAALCFI